MEYDVLFFEVRGRRCALPVSCLREVTPPGPVTPVPLTPPSLCGLLPVHGEVLPIVDIGPKLVPQDPAVHHLPSFTGGERLIILEVPYAEVALHPPPAPGAADEVPVSRAPLELRAGLLASHISRLGAVAKEHLRAPPPGPDFVTATIYDTEGPALLLDPAATLRSIGRDLLPEAVA